MTPGARAAAAIEVLTAIETERRPAQDALKAWGLAHRFAGSGDRAGIGLFVHDALRLRASSAWIMGREDARAVLAGSLHRSGASLDVIAALFSGEGHAPAPLDEAEVGRLREADLSDAPPAVRADVPEWLVDKLAHVYGDALVTEGEALATRAPVDLRVNTLKGSRDKAMKALAHLQPSPTPYSPVGLRILPNAQGRTAALGAEMAYAKGLVEVQDEGSQIASLLAGAEPGMQVLDLCAGGGGKSLAMAAAMGNKGQIYAHDDDGRRLMPILPRLERAGVRNVQLRAPKGRQDVLADLAGRCDVVLVDAPCTGSGTWRRNPDAKWRMRPGALDQRIVEQDEILAKAVGFLNPGGRLVYITCSLLAEENEERVAALMARDDGLLPIDAGHMAAVAGVPDLGRFASALGPGIRLSPRATGTDGFYVASLVRS